MELFRTKVLVTGAEGFLGKHLTSYVGAKGAKVFCVTRASRFTAGPSQDNVSKCNVNLSDASETLAFFEDIRPDIVFHLATASGGSTGIDNIIPHLEDDVRTTVSCLVAAQKVGVRRFIVPGSTDEPIPIATGELTPDSPYSMAKMTCVAYGRMFYELYRTPVVICRIFMTYGPGQKDRKIIPYIIRSMLSGVAPQIASGSRLVDWIYLDDTIEAMVLAATTEGVEGKTIEIGSGRLLSISDITRTIQRMIPGAPDAKIGGMGPYGSTRAANLEAAGRYLHWTPRVSLDEGLRATVASYL
jgi:UDP-glucose 4-epimerase